MFFIHFNVDGTIRKATIRNRDGEQPTDLPIMEAWEFYQAIKGAGADTMEVVQRDGSVMEFFRF